MSALEWFKALPSHARSVFLGAVFALALLLLSVAVLSWQLYTTAQTRLAQAEPRYARLQGLVASEQALRESAEAAAEQLNDLTYPQELDGAAASAAAQQAVRRLFETTGMSVSGSQVLAHVPLEGFDEIRIDLSATGGMTELENLLLALQDARPLMVVRGLTLQPLPSRRRDVGGQRVNLSINLSVFKLV